MTERISWWKTHSVRLKNDEPALQGYYQTGVKAINLSYIHKMTVASDWTGFQNFFGK